MSQMSLEVTYRQGRVVAAYLYLPRNGGDTVEHSRRVGSMVADLTADGRLMGVEFTSLQVDLDKLDRLLVEFNAPAIDRRELAPLIAA